VPERVLAELQAIVKNNSMMVKIPTQKGGGSKEGRSFMISKEEKA
jgi:hypothetical protein